MSIFSVYVNKTARTLTIKTWNNTNEVPATYNGSELVQTCSNMTDELATRALYIIKVKAPQAGITVKTIDDRAFTMEDEAGYLGTKVANLRTATQKPLGNLGCWALLFSESFKGTTCPADKYPNHADNNTRVGDFQPTTLNVKQEKTKTAKGGGRVITWEDVKATIATFAEGINDPAVDTALDNLITAIESARAKEDERQQARASWDRYEPERGMVGKRPAMLELLAEDVKAEVGSMNTARALLTCVTFEEYWTKINKIAGTPEPAPAPAEPAEPIA